MYILYRFSKWTLPIENGIYILLNDPTLPHHEFCRKLLSPCPTQLLVNSQSFRIILYFIFHAFSLFLVIILCSIIWRSKTWLTYLSHDSIHAKNGVYVYLKHHINSFIVICASKWHIHICMCTIRNYAVDLLY